MEGKQEKKIIFYHTQVYFLDTAIEYVSLLASQGYNVHVAIEISPNQLKANILNVNTDLSQYPALTPLNSVVNSWGVDYLLPFFEKCDSVNFVVYPSKKIGKTRMVAKTLARHIKSIKPNYIHLDDFSSRSLFQLSFFYRQRKKLIANIHDPFTHSGEYQFTRELYRKIWFNLFPCFAVFSEYSKSTLQPQLRKNKKVVVLKLMPYTVYKYFLPKIINKTKVSQKFISFVGRISPYKGIELFIDALEHISPKYPEIKFYIAGKTMGGYNPDFLRIKRKNLTIKNKFLSNEEIVSIINNSQLIVCPYKDATQSGVIMTAYALGCPVLVTNTGGLPEYVVHNKTGVLTEQNSSESIASAIDSFLSNDLAMKLCENIVKTDYKDMFAESNKSKFKELYRI